MISPNQNYSYRKCFIISPKYVFGEYILGLLVVNHRFTGKNSDCIVSFLMI